METRSRAGTQAIVAECRRKTRVLGSHCARQGGADMAAEGVVGSATLDIEAAPQTVYALITDVTRMGEWSPETRRAEWVGGATGPAVGARFRGHNKLGIARWSMTPTVK